MSVPRPMIVVLAVSDPRQNGRAAEAVRVAAGLAGWGQLEVRLCLQGPAVTLLDPEGADNETHRQLAGFGSPANPVLLLNSPPGVDGWDLPCPVRPTTEAALALELSQARSILRF